MLSGFASKRYTEIVNKLYIPMTHFNPLPRGLSNQTAIPELKVSTQSALLLTLYYYYGGGDFLLLLVRYK